MIVFLEWNHRYACEAADKCYLSPHSYIPHCFCIRGLTRSVIEFILKFLFNSLILCDMPINDFLNRERKVKNIIINQYLFIQKAKVYVL